MEGKWLARLDATRQVPSSLSSLHVLSSGGLKSLRIRGLSTLSLFIAQSSATRNYRKYTSWSRLRTMATSSSASAPKRRLLRSAHSLPLETSQNTTEANNARHGVKEDVTMSLMNIGWRVRKSEFDSTTMRFDYRRYVLCVSRMLLYTKLMLTLLSDVSEGYKTGPSHVVPSAPPLGHSSSSYSSNSSGTRSSFTSSDTGSLRSTYTNPALSTSAIFLSSSDALSSARASVFEEQERARLEKAQLALLNAMKPRRDLMCLADIVDEDADTQELYHSESLLTTDASRTGYTKADNYHMYLASRPSHTEEPIEEEPYRLERGRKRHTVEEDEGDLTETDDVEGDDEGMDIDQPSNATVAGCSRPIRPMKRSTGFNASSPTPSTVSPSTPGTVTPRNRRLGLSRSAPLALPLSFGEQQERERMPRSELSIAEGGGVVAWIGRTDF